MDTSKTTNKSPHIFVGLVSAVLIYYNYEFIYAAPHEMSRKVLTVHVFFNIITLLVVQLRLQRRYTEERLISLWVLGMISSVVALLIITYPFDGTLPFYLSALLALLVLWVIVFVGVVLPSSPEVGKEQRD